MRKQVLLNITLLENVQVKAFESRHNLTKQCKITDNFL